MATLNIEIDVPIQVGQMIYVDSVVGNDSTGTRGRFDKPYKTPAAAITAASAGDAVRVRPGTYVGNVVLKNGVNIITEPCFLLNCSSSRPHDMTHICGPSFCVQYNL